MKPIFAIPASVPGMLSAKPPFLPVEGLRSAEVKALEKLIPMPLTSSSVASSSMPSATVETPKVFEIETIELTTLRLASSESRSITNEESIFRSTGEAAGRR